MAKSITVTRLEHMADLAGVSMKRNSDGAKLRISISGMDTGGDKPRWQETFSTNREAYAFLRGYIRGSQPPWDTDEKEV